MRFTHILICIFLLLTAQAAHSQQITSSIRGKLIDLASEAPIAYANVTLIGSDPKVGTVSDENGEFLLQHIPVGRHDLKISHIGYEPMVRSGILVTSGKATVLTIQLKESALQADEVVIRPKQEKEKSLNKMATVSARQLSMEEANKFAGGFDDPARLVSSFAGVASNITSNGISVRGNSPKGILWRLEGVEVPNPNHFAEIDGFGGGGITALSSKMLANSDFFTGAFPAEYGNGLSGVFDLSIRNGNKDEYVHSLQAGFLGLDVASEGPLKKGGNASYLFNYRYSTFGLIDAILPEGGLGIGYQDLSVKVNLPTKKAGVFSIWGLGLLDKASSSPDPDTMETEDSKWRYYEDLESDESKISMGVAGLTHKYFFSNKTYLKTIFSASGNQLTSKSGILDSGYMNTIPVNDIAYHTLNYRLSSVLNHKFGARHTNRTGIIATNLNYDVNLQEHTTPEPTLSTFAKEKGSSYLLQAYTQSSFSFGNRFTLNPGLHIQYFALNKNYSIEPRLGANFSISEKSKISFGYGLHSQLEKLSFYLSRVPGQTENSLQNKNLDFAKAHHVVVGFDHMFGDHTHLRVEPYFQSLYDVPVVPDGYFSFINLQDDFFINEKLTNTGKGRNYGVDLTLERFLNKGWYYLVTASIFNSEYQGGDGVWRNTRFNRQVVGNVLIGKEWSVKKKNLFNASIKYSYLGGNWQHPVDEAASLSAKAIVEDLSNPYSEQKPASNVLNLTLTYRINKKKHSSLWSIQVLNLLASPENYGYQYNFLDHTIDPNLDPVVIPNLSYKIEF